MEKPLNEEVSPSCEISSLAGSAVAVDSTVSTAVQHPSMPHTKALISGQLQTGKSAKCTLRFKINHYRIEYLETARLIQQVWEITI